MLKRILSCAICAFVMLSLVVIPGLAEEASRVSYLGPAGTYTEEATQFFFRGGEALNPKETVNDAIAGLLIGFMGATLLDDHCVHFENTNKLLWRVLRLLGGLAVYFALNKLLKLPFSNEFLSSGTTASLLVRCARYVVIAFVDFGIYPMLFRFEKRTHEEGV